MYMDAMYYHKSCFSLLGHSTPNDAKLLRLGHHPSQNLIKIGQVVTIYKI